MTDDFAPLPTSTAFEQRGKGILSASIEAVGVGLISEHMKDTRTDDELNRIIAEWAGWNPAGFIHWKDGPDYCNDLNAIQTTERKLKGGSAALYVDKLCDTAMESPENELPLFLSATARQRAEALVAVIESQKEPHA